MIEISKKWEDRLGFGVLFVLIMGIPLTAINVVLRGGIFDMIVLILASLFLTHIILTQGVKK